MDDNSLQFTIHHTNPAPPVFVATLEDGMISSIGESELLVDIESISETWRGQRLRVTIEASGQVLYSGNALVK
jgi:hypothetical protein